MEEIKALNDDAMEQAAGGSNCPNQKELDAMGLGDIVKYTGGWSDDYYDTYRKETKTWKNVGSEDMLRYVERTLGADDERYQALNDFYKNGTSAPQKPSPFLNRV